MTHEPTPDVKQQGRSVGLWAGVIGSGAVWAAQLQSLYSLTPVVGRSQHYIVLHLLTILFLAGAAACGWLSWRDYQAAGAGNTDDTEGGTVARTRFLGLLGVLVSSMFFILIAAQGMASFYFNASWQ